MNMRKTPAEPLWQQVFTSFAASGPLGIGPLPSFRHAARQDTAMAPLVASAPLHNERGAVGPYHCVHIRRVRAASLARNASR
jgi:hypothetical protein